MTFQQQFVTLLERLDQLSFYRFAEPGKIEHIKAVSLESGDLFPDFYRYQSFHNEDNIPDATQRGYFLDTEDLYEQGVRAFLREIGPALGIRGVTIQSLEEVTSGGNYSICVNGIPCLISKKDDSNQERWTLAAVRTFSVLNRLLQTAGSEDRIYYRYGGNDMQLLFLTDRMYQAIVDSQLLGEGDRPKPVELRHCEPLT